MTQQEVELLLKKYRLGLSSDEEKKAIEDWYEKQFESSKFSLDENAKQELKTWLDASIFPNIDIKPKVSFLHRPLFRYSIAAAFMGLLVTSFLLWKNSNKKDWTSEAQTARFQNNVAPGKSGATWTINNRQSFLLDGRANAIKNNNTNIATQTSDELILDSSVISAGQSFENSITTKNGQQYKVVLSDGTKVWLNAASSLHFKMPFAKNKREIFLTGEAYFEVAHDEKNPFFVITDKDTITVLGTRFNINSYKDEPAYVVTLLEGKIKYRAGYKLDTTSWMLTPNDILLRTQEQVQKTHQEDVDYYVAWKDGYFSFSNEDIHTVMRQLARWYNIQVNYENDNYKEKFYGDLRKDASLVSILSVLEKSGVKFLIQGTKVTVL